MGLVVRESWQSGMWTGTLAFGAWLMWDKLDPALQQGVQRVVAREDDTAGRRARGRCAPLSGRREGPGLLDTRDRHSVSSPPTRPFLPEGAWLWDMISAWPSPSPTSARGT